MKQSREKGWNIFEYATKKKLLQVSLSASWFPLRYSRNLNEIKKPRGKILHFWGENQLGIFEKHLDEQKNLNFKIDFNHF